MRTERPDLPARPIDLTRTEAIKPLVAEPEPGDDVKISRNVLEELYTRLGEAIGAIERGNNRISGNNRLWRCVSQVFKTGKAGSACPKPDEP